MNKIELRSINDLLGLAFKVPAYQRGYRWTRQQVEDLLNDIWEFSQNTDLRDSFYCLQPMIVKWQEGPWELIDGQQRLTTLYILLHYLNEAIFKESVQIFSLEFETRPGSQLFLDKIDPNRRVENIDFHHICDAHDCIIEWLANKQNLRLAATHLYQTVLERTKVIWYQIDDESDPHDIFIRINSGKIPLTNAELIKALFLKRGQSNVKEQTPEFERRQIEIASEWDRIEGELQRDELWYFLNREANQHATRIELVFGSVAGIRPSATDEFATFRHFSNALQHGKATPSAVLEQWKTVKNRFLLFQEWFNNRELYHLVGYLIAVGQSVDELVNRAEELSKSAFQAYLTEQIRLRVDRSIGNLEYGGNNGRDNEILKSVLLLFNVETLRRNAESGYRFPFHQFKGKGIKARIWSLEHIHAQSDRGLNSAAKYAEWLRDVRPFVADAIGVETPMLEDRDDAPSPQQPTQTLIEIDRLLATSEIEKSMFEQVRDQVLTLFGAPDVHTIENLALLTRDDNSALSNGTFPQKRLRIIELEKEGSFIPIATRNVFLKYYTPHAAHLSYWTSLDRSSYVKAIEDTLAPYLPGSTLSPAR